MTLKILGLAEMLDELQAKYNDGRGISCVRAIIQYLSQGRIEQALATVEAEWDKISSYGDIATKLKECGFAKPTWYQEKT